MRRAFRVGIQLTLLVAFANLTAVAQNYLYATGNPVWGINLPIENGFINVANGNVHIEIPIGNQPQRGSLPLTESVIYDSRIWAIVNSGTSYSFQAASGGGWTFGGSAYGGVGMDESQVNESVPCSGSSGNQGYLETVYTWTDSSGTAHMFAPGIYSLYSPNCPNGNTGGITNKSTGTAYAVDGSGYYIVVCQDANGGIYSTIFDQNGNQPGSEDRNGNYIGVTYSWSSNAFTWTDTLGRRAFVQTNANSNTVYLDVISLGGVTKRYTVNYETINVSTGFGQSGVTDCTNTGTNTCKLTVVKSLDLPDGTSYGFLYDVDQSLGTYGELTELDLPTGGAVHFTYQNYLDSYGNQNRWIYTYSGGNGSYSLVPQVVTSCSGSSSVGCQEKMKVTDGNSNEVDYLLTLNNGAWNSQTDYYNNVKGSLVHVLSTATNYNFTNSCPQSICGGPNGVQWVTASSTTTTLSDTGQSTQTQYVYNHPQYGKPDKVRVWDYSTPASCTGGNTPTKETDYTYGYFVNGAAYVTEADQLDCNGNLTAGGKTTYTYDCTSSQSRTCSLSATSGLPNHSNNFVFVDELSGQVITLPMGAIGNRGNLTSVVKGTGPTATISSNYDDAGVKQNDTDANNKQTSYSTMCSDAYVQTVTYPLAVNGQSLQTTTSYDCPSGLVNSTKDMNSQQTTYSYYTNVTNLGRLETVTRPDGGTTTYTYPSSVETDQAVTQSSSVSVTHESILDAYGRTYQSVTLAPEGYISSETTYDTTGRPYSVTSPHLQGTSSTDGTTKTYYDVLGRTTSVVAPNSTTTASYRGNTQTVKDALSNSTKYTYDAFHHLTSVLEPNSSGTPTYETDYQYNALDKLIQVDQWGGANGATSPGDRQRLFNYSDGVGRLHSVTTPEGGTTTYSYLSSNALCAGDVSLPCSKTDARGVVTQYAYDALNRMTSKSYSSDPSGTPTACFQYDSSAISGAGSNLLGHLTNQWTQSASAGACNASLLTSGGYHTRRSILSYDAMGRPQSEQQCTPSNCTATTPYAVSYGYDFAGNLASYSNGLASTPGAGASPLTFYQSFDSAGRLQTVTSTWSDNRHPSSLFSAQSGSTVSAYAPFGAVTNALYGNQITVNRVFNSQLLPISEIDKGSSAATAASGTVVVPGAEQYK